MIELNDKIENIYKNHKLIGFYDTNEEEYKLLLDQTKLLSKRILQGCQIDKRYYKLIFITLVEIAKRWRDSDVHVPTNRENGYWVFVSLILLNENHLNLILYNKFTSIIDYLNISNLLQIVTIGHRYYATLMMHSLAPKSSLFSFFDLCYNIYKKDLDYGYTKDDEWFSKLVALEIKKVLENGDTENRNVTIGSGAYSIRIGLKSFCVSETLKVEFITFINNIFYNINKLFHREKLINNQSTDRFIQEWWKNVPELEKKSNKNVITRRNSRVSKDNIEAKYLRDNNNVYLYIPSFRLEKLDNINITIEFLVNDNLVSTSSIWTKKAELGYYTVESKYELNKILGKSDKINPRVKIKENNNIIYDSESQKSQSLIRDFILFENDKEIINKFNKPTNYFVYSKNIDSLQSKPKNLNIISQNLYNIYPNEGEILEGQNQKVFFNNQIKNDITNNTAYIFGFNHNIKWQVDNTDYLVFSKNVWLCIPKTFNLKSLELRINNKHFFKLEKLYESYVFEIDNDFYYFDLNLLQIFSQCSPIQIKLWWFEKEKYIIDEKISIFSDLIINYNLPFYFGDDSKQLSIEYNGNIQEIELKNNDEKIEKDFICGKLILDIIYLKWKISSQKNWETKPLLNKLWYKDLLEQNSTLEFIDNEHFSDLKLFVKTKENNKKKRNVSSNNLSSSKKNIFIKSKSEKFEINKNIKGQYDIGSFVYNSYLNNNKNENIEFYCKIKDKQFKLFTIATKEHFINEKIFMLLWGNIFWNIKYSFLCDDNNKFILELTSNDKYFRKELNYKTEILTDVKEGIYITKISIKSSNILLQELQLIFNEEVNLNSNGKYLSETTKILLLEAKCDKTPNEWKNFYPKYFIDNIKYIDNKSEGYYIGELFVKDTKGQIIRINKMKNFNGIWETTNPVKIEILSDSTLELFAGYENGEINIGSLFYDKQRNSICNIQKQNKDYDLILKYKYKVVENV